MAPARACARMGGAGGAAARPRARRAARCRRARAAPDGARGAAPRASRAAPAAAALGVPELGQHRLARAHELRERRVERRGDAARLGGAHDVPWGGAGAGRGIKGAAGRRR
jgi:hypothetical protein